MVAVMDTGLDTTHCFFKSADAPRLEFRLGEDDPEVFGKKLQQLA